MEGAFRATRKKRILSYLLLIDVDNFKYINDTYGHEVGDAVLSRISTILRECAGAQDIPARFGGDELAVIINNSNDQLVLAMVHAIQERIEVLSLPSHKDISCTVSIGISCAKNKTSIISWIKEADEMLYEVKRNGKNGFCMKSNKK